MALSANRNQLPKDRRIEEEDYLAADTPLSDMDNGEFLAVASDPDEITLEDTPDGGLLAPPVDGDIISLDTSTESGFYVNLAAYLSDYVKDTIVYDILDKVENDKESRKKRDEQYTEGLRRSGLGNDAPGGAEFEGASRVVHPLLTEACIDYESRVIRELWPALGPVKPNIVGAPTTEKVEQANRVAEHMNWQLQHQMKEARSVFEVTLTQVPLGGSQYIHLWYDHRLKRPRCEFRSIDNMYIPFGAADFYSASRKTYADTISEMELKQRIRNKQYVDVDETLLADLPPETMAKRANDRIEGLDDTGENVDNERQIYEISTYIEITPELAADFAALPAACGCIEEEGAFLPYLITIDPNSRRMLAMYRNFEEDDDTFEPIEHDFEFPFVPWRGAVAIGFPQLIGGLSAAATGALRALLDSAFIANSPGGLIMKGSGAGGQTIRPQVGEYAEIDMGLETKSIRDVVMPFSLTQPSGVLFQLLGFVVEAGRGVIRTSMDDTPSNTPVPVGTQMARLEEGLVVFSAVHLRAHDAFNRFLRGLHRLNRMYLPEIVKLDLHGKELLVRRRDYDGPCVIQGVSNPTIYSDQQRFAQLNYIHQRVAVALASGLNIWKIREVELAGLKLMKWPNPEALLQDMPEPQELNPTNESLSMALGQPVMVFPDQDHKAHLQVHLDFTKSPVLGMNPILAPKYLPIALQHMAEHIAYLYVSTTVEKVREAAQGMDPTKLMSKSVEVKRAFDAMLAQASSVVVPELDETLKGVMPVLQQAQQMLKAIAPPPVMDPAQAAVQAATQETQRKAAEDKARIGLDTQEAQTDAQIRAQANQIAADRVAALREGQQLQSQTKLQTADTNAQTQVHTANISADTEIQTTEMDTETALEVARKNAATHRSTRLENGSSLSD